MTKSEIEGLGKRVDSLEPKPRGQADLSAHGLATEMQMTVKYLTETYGPGFLTDPYGKDHSGSVLELIRKAEAGNYANAADFVRQLSEDEQCALARLIVKVEEAVEGKRNSLRSTFVQAFQVKP